MSRGFEAFTLAWGDFEAPTVGTGANKTFERVWEAVESYFTEYPLASDPITPYQFDENKSGIEFKFAVPLDILHPDTEEPLIFGGRADLLGYYRNILAIIDEKTTSSLGDSWVKQWQMRGQFFGYVWGARQTGLEVTASIVRGVSILKTKIGHLEVYKSNYPQFLLDRWELNMRYKIKQAIEYYTLTKTFAEGASENGIEDDIPPEHIWPMNFSDSCNSYGGCNYLDLCTSKNPKIWYQDYGNERWNPLEETD